MIERKVKIFNAYVTDENYYKNLGIKKYDLFEYYHNQIIKSDGTVSPRAEAKFKNLKPIKPLSQDIEEKIKYELDENEQYTLSMLKHTAKKAKDLYDSCKRKVEKYEHMLIENIQIDDELYDLAGWECNLSPIGKCLYKQDQCGEWVCAFCGEPEERK